MSPPAVPKEIAGNISEDVPDGYFDAVRRMYGGSRAEPKDAFFKKTFQERRTWFQLYRAYFRVIAFHVLWFHILLGCASPAGRPACPISSMHATSARRGSPPAHHCTRRVRPCRFAFANDSTAGDADDSFEGRWWVGISAAVLTHALLSLLYFIAGIYIKAYIPKPPIARSDVRKHVKSTSLVHTLTGGCFGRRERTLTEAERGNEVKAQDWSAPRVARARSLTKLAFMALVFTLLFVALLFLFLAQFAWFPFPEASQEQEAAQGDADGSGPIFIGDQRAPAFFRECAPLGLPLHSTVHSLASGRLFWRCGMDMQPALPCLLRAATPDRTLLQNIATTPQTGRIYHQSRHFAVQCVGPCGCHLRRHRARAQHGAHPAGWLLADVRKPA